MALPISGEVSSRFAARVARESANGQYVLLSDHCTLSVTAATVTVTAGAGVGELNLCHLPLSSALFGAHESKVMIVPANRGPALVVELKQRDEMAAVVASLRAAGVHVQGPPSLSMLEQKSIEEQIKSPGFRATLTHLNEKFAEREQLGLPGLLAVVSLEG